MRSGLAAGAATGRHRKKQPVQKKKCQRKLTLLDRKLISWRTGVRDGLLSDRTARAHKLVSIAPQRFQDLKMFPTANLTSDGKKYAVRITLR
jgi:hypothetical protein